MANYSLPDLTQIGHHPIIEEITEVISRQTRRKDRGFFRAVVAYNLGVVASSMRASLNTPDRGEIPVNLYTLALAPSGFGKGYSTFVVENIVLKAFRESFRDIVMPAKVAANIGKLAARRAVMNDTEEKIEYEALERELAGYGAFPFSFDGGSEPAIKQVRQMLLLSGCGSLNLQVDEIGMNLEKSSEPLRVYLELFDQGMIKQKLTKNSSDNKRTVEIEGKTPANALLFGTPSKLLDSGPIERMFYGLLETGYARRCLFAWGKFMPGDDRLADPDADIDEIIEELYAQKTDTSNDVVLEKWSAHLASLADIDKFGWTIEVTDDIAKRLLAYQLHCEHRAKQLPEEAEIRRAELDHRYYKALKLAGALAFVDESLSVTNDQLYQAIKLVEESGDAFQQLLNQEPPHKKLARFITGSGRELTHADILDALPCYRGSASHRSEMLTMATAFGYREHMIIRKEFQDGIEIISGEALQETSLESVRLAFSDDYAKGYEGVDVPFRDLSKLIHAPDMHWINHHVHDGHRADENIIPGFNMAVVDIDNGPSLQLVHEMLAEYVFTTYTTKRHDPAGINRFRLILPINYELKLNQEDYRQFMNSIMDWLPFKGADEGSNQRARKWLTNPNAVIHTNLDGRLVDALPFVPKTSRNEQLKGQLTQLKDYDALERWFAVRIAEGNRNNNMAKFAFALVDAGLTYTELEARVIAFNRKLSNGLSQDELKMTILKSAASRIQSRNTP